MRVFTNFNTDRTRMTFQFRTPKSSTYGINVVTEVMNTDNQLNYAPLLTIIDAHCKYKAAYVTIPSKNYSQFNLKQIIHTDPHTAFSLSQSQRSQQQFRQTLRPLRYTANLHIFHEDLKNSNLPRNIKIAENSYR